MPSFMFGFMINIITSNSLQPCWLRCLQQMGHSHMWPGFLLLVTPSSQYAPIYWNGCILNKQKAHDQTFSHQVKCVLSFVYTCYTSQTRRWSYHTTLCNVSTCNRNNITAFFSFSFFCFIFDALPYNISLSQNKPIMNLSNKHKSYMALQQWHNQSLWDTTLLLKTWLPQNPLNNP